MFNEQWNAVNAKVQKNSKTLNKTRTESKIKQHFN